MEDSTRSDLIKGGLRTLSQFVPIVGGAFSQAWSEYETHRQNQRVEEFFNSFGVRLKTVESQVSDLKDRVEQLPDAPELLEEIVENVKRETDDQKRQFYVNALIHFVREPRGTSRDERRSIIENLDVLTLEDLNYLRKFRGSAPLRGDMLTGTSFVEFTDAGQKEAQERHYEQRLAPAIHSLSKLEARGLITKAAINATFGWSGEGDTWYNQFRRDAWRMMPIGQKLLNSIQE